MYKDYVTTSFGIIVLELHCHLQFVKSENDYHSDCFSSLLKGENGYMAIPCLIWIHILCFQNDLVREIGAFASIY